MAPGLPYAIAAQHAYPGRQVIAFVGDGGFAMLMAEFLTAVRHELPIKVVINNNGSYGQILWEQMVLGYPEFGVRHKSFADFAPWAQSCGGLGIKVTKPAISMMRCKPPSPRRPRARRLRRQPERAADARRRQQRAGEGLRRGVHARPATQGRDREDTGGRHDGEAEVVKRAKPAPVGIDRLLVDIRTGHFEKTLSALAAVGAAVTTGEIYLSHDSASFGNKMMWVPVFVMPTIIPAGIAGVFSKRAAKTVLAGGFGRRRAQRICKVPICICAGSAQKPGGLRAGMRLYNAEMGPPVFAPLLASLVGGMGILAAILRREGE